MLNPQPFHARYGRPDREGLNRCMVEQQPGGVRLLDLLLVREARKTDQIKDCGHFLATLEKRFKGMREEHAEDIRCPYGLEGGLVSKNAKP